MIVEIDVSTLMLVRVFLGLALSVALTLGICEIFGVVQRSGTERARE
jgi:hypothetical protein